MVKYLGKVKQMKELFKSFKIKQVLRTQNVQTDALSKLASATPSQIERIVHLENRLIPSIVKQKLVLQVSNE